MGRLPSGASGGGASSLAIKYAGQVKYRGGRAISGKPEQSGYLREIGASKILLRATTSCGSGTHGQRRLHFAAALDNVGGQFLDRLCITRQAARQSGHRRHGACGDQDDGAPFVLRSVDILHQRIAPAADA